MQALKLRPDYADAHCNIGQALTGLEDFPKAHTAYKNALKLRPDYPEAQIGIARLLQEDNQLDQAINIMTQVTQANPDKLAAYTLLGNLYTETGCYTEAQAAFDSALRAEPEHTG